MSFAKLIFQQNKHEMVHWTNTRTSCLIFQQFSSVVGVRLGVDEAVVVECGALVLLCATCVSSSLYSCSQKP